MRYRSLGSTGVRVAELCLGAMTWGGVTPLDEARRIFERYVESGGNFLDTAVNYADGASEEIVGRLIEQERDRFVLATKYTAPLRRDDLNSGGNHAKALRQALETSLRRLRTDHIDLYWVHAWDQATPLEELVRALEDAVASGKVLYVGISNTPAWAIARATTLAELNGRARVAAIQVEHSLVQRTVERELIPMATHLALSVLAWGPLAGGLLSGKYLPGATARDEPRRLADGDRRLNEHNLSIAAEVVSVANDLDATPAAVALAWLRTQSARPIAILGARTTTQLEQQLACLKLELPGNARERLDRVSAVALGYPHDFLRRVRAAYASTYGSAGLAGPGTR